MTGEVITTFTLGTWTTTSLPRAPQTEPSATSSTMGQEDIDALQAEIEDLKETVSDLEKRLESLEQLIQ